VRDIIKELEKPGLDPRKSAKIFEFDECKIDQRREVRNDMES
jgi:uncharacterized protein